MIIVVGRPCLSPRDRPSEVPDGLAALVAVAAAARGAPVELAGAIGDDAAADVLTVALGRAGVGHAALLRVAGAATPRAGDPPAAWPRFEAADLDLGLRYLLECRVLVLAEPLPPTVQEVALEAAGYHGAALVAIVADEGPPDARLAEAGTVLVAPVGALAPFADLVGRFAAELDGGAPAEGAFRAVAAEVGWEPAS